MPTVLMGLLAISAVASLYFCYESVMNTSELNRLQNQASMVNQNRAVMNAVASEALEYSKHNPAIDPILEEAKIKPSSHPQTPTKSSK
jgi:hypothetical protein